MPFGMVSGVGQWMGVLDGGGDRRREMAVLGVNLGHPIVTNGTLLHSFARAMRSSQLTLRGLVLVLVVLVVFVLVVDQSVIDYCKCFQCR